MFKFLKGVMPAWLGDTFKSETHTRQITEGSNPNLTGFRIGGTKDIVINSLILAKNIKESKQ